MKPPMLSRRILIVSALSLIGASGLAADAVFIDFESLPDAYFYSGGDENIGSLYPGITFGPNVTGLSVSRFGGYSSSAFPPHSGNVVIWDASDATINIVLASAAQSFGIWYTSYDPLTLQTFDSVGNPLSTAIGDPNTDGTSGTSSFLSISASGIQSAELTGTPGFFVLDDLTVDTGTTAVPEPTSTALVVIGLLLAYQRHRSKGPLDTPSASSSYPRS